MDLLNFKNNRFALTFMSIFTLLLIKIIFNNSWAVILTNTFIDSLILILIYLLTSSSPSIRFNQIIFYILYIPHFLIFSFNSIFLSDSIIMKYSLSNFNIGSTLFLIKSIIPWKYFIILPLIIGLLIYLSFKKIPYEKYFIYFVFGIICLSLIVLPFNVNSISNIYVNTIGDAVESSNYELLELNHPTNISYNFSSYDKELKPYSQYVLPDNKRILIFIMEEMSYDTFWKKLSKVPLERNFFLKVQNHTHSYTNFYTNNQDSRTTIWTMFNSQFLPFECYIDEWPEKYGFVLEDRNLVDFFNYHDYETHVASSVSHPGILLGAYNWQNLTFIKDYDVNNEDFLCIHALEYQKGCEDLILIEDVKRIVNNDKLFFLQEFIYGHGSDYEESLGLSRTEYYNEYLFQLYEHLEKENLLDDTIIMIVADHGEKGHKDKDLFNYQLPLFVISNDLNYTEINDLYLHIDFKDILLSYLINETLTPNTGGLVIGQTQTGEVAYVGPDKNFIGKLSMNKLKLKSVSNMNYEEITNQMYKLFAYQNYCEEDSLKNEHVCEYCYQNVLKSQE